MWEFILQLGTILGGIVGGAAATKAVEHFGRYKREKLKANHETEKREDSQKHELDKMAFQVLKTALDEEREAHRKCLERLNALETQNEELRRKVDILTKSIFASYSGDLISARKLLDKIEIKEQE
jgi:gas vesicle protein